MNSDVRRHALSALLLAAVFAGCSDALEPDKYARRTVAVADIPASVMDAAKKDLPGVRFEEAWKNVDAEGKLHSYEIRGRAANGKVREVRITEKGEILERE